MNVWDLFKEVYSKGGFTFRPGNDSFPSKGFVVAVYPGRCQVIAADAFKCNDILNYAIANQSLFVKDAQVYMGAWHEVGAENVYLDCVVVVDTEQEAVELGKKHAQKAVYDLAGKRDIPCL